MLGKLEINGSLVLSSIDHDRTIIVPRAFRAHAAGVISQKSLSFSKALSSFHYIVNLHDSQVHDSALDRKSGVMNL